MSIPGARNNFPATDGQVVRSNLFLLGHNPFLVGQISIASYLYKFSPPPSPPARCLHIKQVHFLRLYCQAASNSMHEKWNARYSRNLRQNNNNNNNSNNAILYTVDLYHARWFPIGHCEIQYYICA